MKIIDDSSFLPVLRKPSAIPHGENANLDIPTAEDISMSNISMIDESSNMSNASASEKPSKPRKTREWLMQQEAEQ